MLESTAKGSESTLEVKSILVAFSAEELSRVSGACRYLLREEYTC